MNIVIVLSDTLRTAYLGCYGNPTIRTPNIDCFADEGTVFTQVYPEALPTIPMRRTLYTGRRTYPFRDYRPLPWDIVYLPGWQPMFDGESSLAEDLARAGYHTGLVTDTLPYFAPGMNFTRGFWQWEFIRGQQQDRWKSGHAADPDRLRQLWFPGIEQEDPHSVPYYYVANNAGRERPENTSTAQVFQWAMQFVEDNASAPFYLLVDCFDPHECWEAPEEYYRLYADGSYADPTVLFAPYQRDLGGLSTAQVQDIIAHYSGLVTLIDDWFGKLLEKLEALQLREKTLVILTSDHGTNFGDNLWQVMGKPAWALLPGTMHIPLVVRHPEGLGAGQRIEGLRYNLDITASAYEAAQIEPSQTIDGFSLLPALSGDPGGGRDYLTSRYGHTVWHFDGEWWAFCEVDGKDRHLFQVIEDPGLQNDLGASPGPVWEKIWQRILADAGGELPDYRDLKATDAIGQRPVR